MAEALGLPRIMFPSPCGEKVGINRGHQGQGEKLYSEVSVPLRGKGRDQLLNLAEFKVNGFSLFPSPCGEKVGINGL